MIWHFLRYGSAAHQFYNARIDGRLAEQCVLCGHYRVVLDGKVIIGPAQQQVPDLGARDLPKAQRVMKDNVREFRQSER